MSTAKRARQSFDARMVSGAAKRIFGADSKDAMLIMAWLADACHATENVSRGTVEDTYRAIGRREIWLLIQDAMRMTEDDIRDLQEQVAGWDQ